MGGLGEEDWLGSKKEEGHPSFAQEHELAVALIKVPSTFPLDFLPKKYHATRNSGLFFCFDPFFPYLMVLGNRSQEIISEDNVVSGIKPGPLSSKMCTNL